MTDTKQVAAFLEKVPLFNNLSGRQLERLAIRFVERDYSAGQAIVTQGQGGEGFFIIESGHAQAIRIRSDGTRTVVNEFGPGDFFGELALLDDGLRTASVVTTEPTRCVVLTRWDFQAGLREDTDMAIVVLQEMARRFRRALDAM
jgi:CRP-like cAMP-binding protein